ncbi:hypothetical protein ABT104_29135 [Streptomyces mobaraensis]|uniref:hypothetical protein n=1 Tax=Streptomyces mobaraensis TaxID=35621 RepID=UPI0033237BD7
MSEGNALADRIAGRRAGTGDPQAVVGEFRRSVVLVPMTAGGLWTQAFGGVRWIIGFTDEAALARFARVRDSEATRVRDARAGLAGTRPWEYAALRGARLLDEIVPSMGCPAGVALDIADPDGAMFFPPVKGIVPEAVAVDTRTHVEGKTAPGSDAGPDGRRGAGAKGGG